MAVSEGMQLTPHPFREGVLCDTDENTDSTPTLLSVSNTVERLAQYIIAISGQQRSTDARLASWVESIAKVRAALAVSSAQWLSEQNTASALESAIHNFLKYADLLYGGRTLQTTVDLGYGVAVGVLAAVFVEITGIARYLGHAPEIGIVAGTVTLAARAKLAERTAEKLTYLTQKSLLESGAGIVRRHWSDEGRLSS